MSNFDEFKDSAERVDTLKNFTMVFNCLNAKDIPFDASFAKNIINKEPGIVVKLVNVIVQKNEHKVDEERLNRETKKNTAKVNVKSDYKTRTVKDQTIT